MRVLSLVLSSALFASCGGSSGESQGSTVPVAPAAAADPTADSERKLRVAQEHAVEAMCERLVDCAVEEAGKEQTAAEAEASTKPEVVAKARGECEAEYGQLSLSGRQVRLIQRCVNEARECPALEACLADVNKK